MNFDIYLDKVSKRYSSGISKEHSYRGDFELFIASFKEDIVMTNEPSNVTDCGNPDFVLTRNNIPIGYIEAKDVGKDLNSKSYKEQFDRYKSALDNLIITDYLWFQFYIEGELTFEIKIGELRGTKVIPLTENFDKFSDIIKSFLEYQGQTIKSPKKLAEMMAGKARLFKVILENALLSDESTQENTALRDQYESFKLILIHDLKLNEFADIYAQTLAYGMFAARLHDKSLNDFDRKEAAELIPKSNPFLRKLFQYIAGFDIDDRIKVSVDNLAEVFRATDLAQILKNFGSGTQSTDPIIHFYETFLAEYNPKLRKTRGVYYTPEPVVKFIINSVDVILKKKFELSDGLADTAKTTVKVKVAGLTVNKGKNKGSEIFEEREVHKVQILDPATGTGTFLSEIIKYISKNKFKNLQGAWSRYVDNELIPRIHGFEILMASYAMAHLKLDLLLNETGYKALNQNRFNIYLTNTLEKEHPDTGTLFANWLSTEANEANYIKRDSPVMVVLGNPPYSVSSSNKGEWIQNLLKTYKENLNEKKINLDDDYIKFIRFGQVAIDKNNEGILAYITNNSFLSGVTHRQMRKSLLESFDEIYIIDLHGNIKQKEIGPDGRPEENVFDISQGVSINIFVKKTNIRSKNAKVFHVDVFGKRKEKYDYLNTNTFEKIEWNELKPKEPYFFFTNKNLEGKTKYDKGFSVEELFLEKNTGIQTKNDDLTIQYSKQQLEMVINDFKELSIEELKLRYGSKEGTWKYSNAKNDILSGKYEIVPILFKPFDIRYTALTEKSNGFLGRPRYKTMRHMIGEENLALLLGRQNKSSTIDSFLITKFVSEMKCAERTIQSYHFPLYLYNENTMDLSSESNRKPNLNMEIIAEVENVLGIKFEPEKSGSIDKFSPIDILDYIYAILYSPKYRGNYEDLLKIDFPRIPFPTSKKGFWELVNIGAYLRDVHINIEKELEWEIEYPIDGTNKIETKVGKSDWKINDNEKIGKIMINDSQYFDNIPVEIWDMYIGGYQPAQKWLKDRHQETLSYEDIRAYQYLINCLFLTRKIMSEIDKKIPNSFL